MFASHCKGTLNDSNCTADFSVLPIAENFKGVGIAGVYCEINGSIAASKSSHEIISSYGNHTYAAINPPLIYPIQLQSSPGHGDNAILHVGLSYLSK
jgi:hypothetical protein